MVLSSGRKADSAKADGIIDQIAEIHAAYYAYDKAVCT